MRDEITPDSKIDTDLKIDDGDLESDAEEDEDRELIEACFNVKSETESDAK